MNTTRIMAATAVLAGILAISSCVKDKDPVFDKSPSVRMTETLAAAQKVLMTPENGWLMEYYADDEQSYGGCVYILKFTKDSVTVSSDLMMDPDYTERSLYRMATDNGPCLSFDTNNYIFHYWATPSGSQLNLYGDSRLYEAHKGDFQFLILEAKPEMVLLEGIRSGCKIRMRPLTRPAKEYLADVLSVEDRMLAPLFVYGDVEASIDFDNLQFSYTTKNADGEKVADKSGKMAFCYTDTGIRFYEPITVGSSELEALDWVDASKSLTNGSVTFEGVFPDGWISYSDYQGEYTLTFGTAGTYNVTIRPDVKNKTLLMDGFVKSYPVTLQYTLSTGNLILNGQVLDRDDTYYYQLCVWDPVRGYVNYSTDYGFESSRRKTDDGSFVIDFKDSGMWVGYEVAGFITYYFRNSDSGRVAQVANTSPYAFANSVGRVNGSAGIYLTKKQ